MKKTECFESIDGALWKTEQEAKEQDFRVAADALEKKVCRLQIGANTALKSGKKTQYIASCQVFWESLISDLTELLNMAVQLVPQQEALRQHYEKKENEEIPS
jgi:hypothetical protein